MTYNYDELFARYTGYITDGSVADLIDCLECDFDNWADFDGDASHLPAVDGLFTHDEAVWLYNQLKQVA